MTYHDTAHAFTISHPRSWQRARESLAPGLTDPHEILSVATFNARADGGHCGHVPAGAASRMDGDDVLLTIQERRGSGGFEERMRPFVLGPPRQGDLTTCGGRPDLQERSGGFQDGGRGLHVLAAFSAGAPASARRDAERVVDSLELEPPWRYRGMDVRMQPPSGWRVKARGSHFNFGSFDVPPPPDEQCALPGGAKPLPADGAFVFVFEYVGLNRTQRRRFPTFPRFSLRARDRRTYECFGDSWLFRWRDRGRPFQAHAYLGRSAGPQRRRELRAALRSIVALRR